MGLQRHQRLPRPPPTAFFQTWGHGGVYIKAHYLSGFAQDQWQPKAGLTIDVGVRYQFDHYPTDISAYTLPESVFNPSTLERTDQADAANIARRIPQRREHLHAARWRRVDPG